MSVKTLDHKKSTRSDAVATKPVRRRDNVSDEFRRKLADSLERTGKTQVRVAGMTGISQDTISRIISGETNPSLAQAAKIARALGVSLEWLADDEMKNPPARAERTKEEERILELAAKVGSIDSIVILDNVDNIGVELAKRRLLDQSGVTGDHSHDRPLTGR